MGMLLQPGQAKSNKSGWDACTLMTGSTDMVICLSEFTGTCWSNMAQAQKIRAGSAPYCDPLVASGYHCHVQNHATLKQSLQADVVVKWHARAGQASS